MSAYRDEARHAIGEAQWTFWKAFPLVMLAVVMLSAVGFGLHSVGLLGTTVVERKVFEQSYQKQAAMNSQIATDEAVLAEIERKLLNPSLDAGVRHNLEAQASAARIRIATTRKEQP